MVPGPSRELSIAKAFEDPAQAGRVEGYAVFVVDPAGQVHQSPANNPMNGGNGPLLDELDDCGQLLGVQLRLRAGRLARDQTLRAFRVKPHRPIPQNLPIHAPDGRGLSSACSVIGSGQRQKAPHLPSIATSACKRTKTLSIIVSPKRNRSRHGGHLPRANRIVLRPSRESPASQIFSRLVSDGGAGRGPSGSDRSGSSGSPVPAR